MPLSIKNPHTEQLARELAERTGESITTAVTVAVRDLLRSRMPLLYKGRDFVQTDLESVRLSP